MKTAIENEPVRQGKGIEDEEKLGASAKQAMFIDHRSQAAAQRRLNTLSAESTTSQLQRGPSSQTGLPDTLRQGIEALSGMSMGHVKVHYNSSQPAQLNAYAYAQGSDIHVAPGQERHLPHEAWHVVQQAQGRVRPTMQMKAGVQLNDDENLEREADVMGEKAMQLATSRPQVSSLVAPPSGTSSFLQRRTLEQAGLNNGMAGVADQTLVGGDVGPSLGVSYTANLGDQPSKTAALSAAGASYAGFSAGVPIANLLSRTQIADAISACQNAISLYISGLEGDAVTTTDEAATHIKNNILEPAINPAIKTDISDGELTAILTAIRQPITKNGANKFFSQPKAAAPLTQHVRMQINNAWRGNANVSPIDPFLYRAQSTVSGEILSVSFQHSHDWPGYVTHIQSGGNNAIMRLNGAIANSDVPGIPDNFGRKHHETGDDNLANDLDLDANDTRVTNERRLDSMTKLAGEGARFVCVRSNLDIMTDRSRFYVTGNGNGDPTKYVTLEDLWSSWATGFQKRNNIPNVDVRAAIATGALWTYGHQAGRTARVHDPANDPAMGGADVDLT